MWSESGFIATFLQLLINFILFILFILGTCKSSLRHRPMTTCLIAISYIAVSISFLMLFITDSSPLRKFWPLLLLLWIGFSILIGMLVLQSSALQITFLLFAILNIQFNMMEFTQIIFQLEFMQKTVKNGDVLIIVANLIALAFIGSIVWYFFFNLFNKAISLNFDKTYWKYLIFIPISAYLFSVFYDMGHRIQTNDGYVISFVMLLLLNVLTYLSYTAILQMIIKTNQSLVATQKATNIEQLLHIKNDQYKSLADGIAQNDRLYHDMRHHFITLRGYIEKKDFENANEYLVKCMGENLAKESTPLCGNQSIDMILRHYIAVAKEFDVQVDVSVNLPSSLKISDIDLCVLFGNLVENAVDACKKQTVGHKFITLKAKRLQNNMLAITIFNSFSGDVIRNGNSFVSTKHDGMGIGTASVRSIVEQNGGNCRFHVENNVFKVSILLIS